MYAMIINGNPLLFNVIVDDCYECHIVHMKNL